MINDIESFVHWFDFGHALIGEATGDGDNEIILLLTLEPIESKSFLLNADLTSTCSGISMNNHAAS